MSDTVLGLGVCLNMRLDSSFEGGNILSCTFPHPAPPVLGKDANDAVDL
jgi:hypothetical protein